MLNASPSVYTRSLISAMHQSRYFTIDNHAYTEVQANQRMVENKVQFILKVPPHFSEDLVRGRHPQLLLVADATDSVATASAVAAMSQLVQKVFDSDLRGPLASLRSKPGPVTFVTHAAYNPMAITRYSIVPGLLGVVITLTLSMIAAMALTREYESGTIESLLATPIKPLEVMLGKVIPYIALGFVQAAIILLAGYFGFSIPFQGNLLILLVACFVFIIANLCVGLFFSSIAKTQLQASQLAIFYFLPSLLLSGFMFPFRGMPVWAQWIGNVLPLTHFLRIIRGIMLKGMGFVAMLHDLWPIVLFLCVAMILNVLLYRRTLN